jgi:hypothetical protein
VREASVREFVRDAVREAAAPEAAARSAPPREAAVAAPRSAPALALGGVQALPAAAAAPADDPVPRSSLAPSRPRAPIVVPPGRTRREGNPPPIRFPRWEQVPKEITAKLCIDPRGSVTSVTVLSRVSSSGRAVVETALSRWRYRPVIEGTEAVAACFATTFRVQVD